MKAFLLKTIFQISSSLGSWPIRFFAWWISTGYFLFHSSRRRASVELYRVILPDRSLLYYLYCAWRQFHSFAATYADRMEVKKNEVVTSTKGAEGILEAVKEGRGGIILMSHLGSYEIAAFAFQKRGFKHLIIMGEKEAKQVPREQREALAAQGVQIQVATGQEGTLLGGLEAIKFIREGGFVSLAADLVWTEPHSRVPVKLFGHEVNLSSGPHLLALVSGAPIFTLFTFRIKRGRHQILISPARFVKASSRSERNQALQASAQVYASLLEKIVSQHPFQWYIFEPFFQSAPVEEGNSKPGLSPSDPGRDRR